MIAKFMFGIFCALFALNQSLARTGLKNVNFDCYECDTPPTLMEDVDYLLQQGFTKYKNDYCKVAQYVSDELRIYPGGEWVVIIGAHGLMGKGEHFAAAFDRVPNSFIFASYKKIHDVLVVKPLCQQPNQDVIGSGGSTLDFTDIKSDMTEALKRRLASNINSIFVNTNANYKETANQAWNYVKNTCGGRWFVLVGPELVLTNHLQLCGVAKKYYGTTFNATYEYSDSIRLFSPVCN